MWNSPWLKRIVFIACCLPLAWLAWLWQHQQLGINAIEFVARYTGNWTFRFLLASLAITPLRRIPGLGPLIKFRRMLGLFAFFYATVHMLHYYAIDVQWNWTIIGEDLTIRRFFIAGMLAWVLMVPLALTSFDAAIRRLGGKRWQLLHRLVYVSALAGAIHYLLQGKGLNLVPLLYLVLLVLLLAIRIVFFVQKNRKNRRA